MFMVLGCSMFYIRFCVGASFTCWSCGNGHSPHGRSSYVSPARWENQGFALLWFLCEWLDGFDTSVTVKRHVSKAVCCCRAQLCGLPVEPVSHIWQSLNTFCLHSGVYFNVCVCWLVGISHKLSKLFLFPLCCWVCKSVIICPPRYFIVHHKSTHFLKQGKKSSCFHFYAEFHVKT